MKENKMKPNTDKKPPKILGTYTPQAPYGSQQARQVKTPKSQSK